jgi:[ribosomal protein S5]-alanine N-acetyltransferase
MKSARWRHMIEGEQVYLRELGLDDVSDRYCAWLNDAEVNRFLETRFVQQTPERVAAYVEAQLRADDALLLAIVRSADDRHLGNLRIGAIDRGHQSATIALVVGEKEAWGRGVGTEAIRLATRYAFDTLGLRKLTARCYASNLGSIRAFERAGWTREGLQRSQFVCGDAIEDGVWLGCVNDRAAV